jgi:hypothetical protein
MVTNHYDLTRMTSGGSLADQILGRTGVPALVTRPGFDAQERAAWAGCLHGGLVQTQPTTTLVPVADSDIGSGYPTFAHARGWQDYLLAEHFTVDHPHEEVRQFLGDVGDAAAAHDFAAVKHLAFDATTLLRYRCTRLVVRSTVEPYLPAPVELYERGAHGRLVVEPVQTTGDLTLDLALGDVVGGVVAASAATRVAYRPEVVDVARISPVGRLDGLTKVVVLGEPVDPYVDDFAVVLVCRRTRLKDCAARLEVRAARLDVGDPRRSKLEHRFHQALRRAAVLRVVVNAMTYGNFARTDGTSGGGSKPGPWWFAPLAATATGDVRMVLAIVRADIEARGGGVLATDTDGILAAVSPDGGETVETNDGHTFRALSWAEHDQVLGGLDHLALDQGDFWKVERSHA